MNQAFYAWFLRELIAALEAMSLEEGQPVTATRITASSSAGHLHATPGGPIVTPRQSNLPARPRQRSEVIMVAGQPWTLGDGKRFTPPQFPPLPGYAQPVLRLEGEPWLPPWPIMPPQAGAWTVNWAGPHHASHVWFLAQDNLWDNGYPRHYGVEASGVFPDPKLRRCEADWRMEPLELAIATRYNTRLPVAAGLDENGPYLRVPALPLNTHEYRELYEVTASNGGGDPL